MLAAGLIAGGLFNVLWISGIRVEARRCAESSAISAGHSYLSDDLLRTSQQSFEYDGRTARCKDAAVAMADQYCRQAALPGLSSQDIHLAWPSESDALKNAALVPTRITVDFDAHDDGFRIPLFFSGLTGLRNTRLGVSASVSMEHAPGAFRPGPQAAVPMLPFAILNDAVASSVKAESALPGHWTKCIESGSGRDRYSWNNDLHQFELGPDGLPEITVTLYPDGSTGADAFVPLSFCASRAGQSSSATSDWVKSGLTQQGLQSLGRSEVTFPGTLPSCPMSLHQIEFIAVVLRAKISEPCIVSLCSSADSGEASEIKLTRPVGARIIRVTTSIDDGLKITLQPCVLVTATAVTSREPALADNRYVYSVRLCD